VEGWSDRGESQSIVEVFAAKEGATALAAVDDGAEEAEVTESERSAKSDSRGGAASAQIFGAAPPLCAAFIKAEDVVKKVRWGKDRANAHFAQFAVAAAKSEG
jgi:hypothetical protein